METSSKNTVDMHQFRSMVEKAKTIDDLEKINSIIPKLTPEQAAIAHKNLDDGIYDESGLLIGEKHPED